MTSPGEMSVRVRAATRGDMPAVHAMIKELAAYEGVPDASKLSVEDLLKDGFDCSPPWFFALVAERCDAAGDAGSGEGGGELLGYALCNRAYSSWTCRAFYIEDIFVRPSLRRSGVGTRLFEHIAQLAVAEGVHRIDWHVLESNERARAFYAALGARDLHLTEGRAALRLDDEYIQRLAQRAAATPAGSNS